MKRENISKAFKQEKKFLIFLVPALAIYIVFSIYPLFSSFYYSLTDWDGYSKNINFVGLANFRYMFKDASFYMALKHTIIFVIMDVVLQNLIGLLLALLLESQIRGKNIFRGLFFIPVVLPSIVVSYIWTYFYSYHNGVLNAILGKFNILSVDFIGNAEIAIYFVVLTGIWQWMSYRMVIYVSGIQNIPAELFEAAEIDGASRWQKVKKITFPLLMPAFKINLILCIIGALKQFDIVYTMTNGGPGNATEVIATKIFHEAFSYSDYGYGCAIGVFLFAVIMIVTIVINHCFSAKEEYM